MLASELLLVFGCPIQFIGLLALKRYGKLSLVSERSKLPKSAHIVHSLGPLVLIQTSSGVCPASCWPSA